MRAAAPEQTVLQYIQETKRRTVKGSASGAWWYKVERQEREAGRGTTTQCLVGDVKGFGLTLKEKPLEGGMDS